MMKINYEEVTVHDCLVQYEMNDKTVIINDGKVLGFLNDDGEDRDSCQMPTEAMLFQE